MTHCNKVDSIVFIRTAKLKMTEHFYIDESEVLFR